jgi:hypothetical protein
MSAINSFVSRVKQGPLLWLTRALPPSTKASLRRGLDQMTRPKMIAQVRAQTSQTNDLLAALMYETARATPRFQDPKRLLGSGFKVYSQHDEDGIIEEIFRRIGTTNQFFVEFGAGDGIENTTLYCLAKGWRGVWIDGSAACYEGIQVNLRSYIASGHLKTKYSFITAENIESLFGELGVPKEPDLMVIDLDRNDYWVWKAINNYRPRVACVEYNASFRQTLACAVPYNPNAINEGTNYFGVSLKGLEILGRQKGYCLVGCNYTGVDAFFVREDLVGDHFARPFTSENHYEPARYFCRMPNGHPPAVGPLELIRPDGAGDAEPQAFTADRGV